MNRRACLIAMALVLALPGAAHGQGNPFQPLPAPVPAPAPPTTTPSSRTTSDDSGLETWQEILIYVGGAGLLFGIGWAIVLDARRRAPAEERRSDEKPKGTSHAPQRKAKARSRAKAARAARRHNR